MKVTKVVSLLVIGALLSATMYGALGDMWDLQGDFSTWASGNPHTVARPSGAAAIWEYTHERATLLGPVTNNFQSEMPFNIGWTTTGGWAHTSMNLFSQSSAAAGLGTNWLAGEVGGHSSTSFGVGAKWTSLTGGTFQVDVTGFSARLVPNTDHTLRLTNPAGFEDWFVDKIVNNGSANAVSATRNFTLLPGEVLRLEMIGSDWMGMTMHITEVPEPATMALLGIGGLALLRRKRS